MKRTNEQWLNDLRSDGAAQAAALEDLRILLLRGSLYTFTRYHRDLRYRSDNELLGMAEDCAQDALLAVLNHLDNFRGESQFSTWAYKFAVNIALTTARRELWKGISLDELVDDEAGEWESLIRDETPGPTRSVMQSEVVAVIQEIVATQLTSRQRQILQWMVLDDVPMDVVVERTGSNRNAIYKMLHDARQKMKHHLEARGFGIVEAIDLFGI